MSKVVYNISMKRFLPLVVVLLCVAGYTYAQSINAGGGNYELKQLEIKLSSIEKNITNLTAKKTALTTQLENIKNCGLSNQIWDGTSCIDLSGQTQCGTISANLASPSSIANPIRGGDIAATQDLYKTGTSNETVIQCSASYIAASCSVFGNNNERVRMSHNFCVTDFGDSWFYGLCCKGS